MLTENYAAQADAEPCEKPTKQHRLLTVILDIAIYFWAISMVFGGSATSFALIIASCILLGLGEGLRCPMQSTFIKNGFHAYCRSFVPSYRKVNAVAD